MSRRAVAAVLWFIATWAAYEVGWSLMGVPRLVGPILAFGIAALVTIDPMALFWPRRDSGGTVAARTPLEARLPTS